MFTIEELYEFSQEEMVKIVLEMQDYIFDLEYKNKKLKQERTEKISKDYNDYRDMVANLLIGVVK